MGFVVGCVVVYQPFSDVTDHLLYATLLAMGYRLKSFSLLLLERAFYWHCLVICLHIFWTISYSIIRNSTKLPILWTQIKQLIFLLVLVMCMGSAGIAMRKLVDADPAEIF